DLNKKVLVTRKGEYEAKAIVIASGAKRRKLGVAGEDNFVGRGISYCATCDGALYRGRHVCVVGGGATAIEDAEYLSAYSTVTLIHRRDTLRADEASIRRVMNDEKVSFMWDSVVSEVKGSNDGLELLVSSTRTGEITSVDCAGCFVAIGTQPVSELYEGQIKTVGGYIEAGEDTKTSVEGVFAAGDIRTKSLRQVITAASDGATAAYEATRYIRGI
ncbi:MAG: FAD-dependent oxidoreductase, partial [Clostridia bacterium]|nr:FAD-dependent oxidoreductase [Clostridia bacterium]